MTWAEGYYDSMYGRIRSAWKLDGKALTYRATVPANTTATLYLPASAPGDVKEGGKPVAEAQGVTFLRQEGGRAVFRLKSGNYEFSARSE
jgi:alpha-L-rhamnosidase